MTRYYEELPYFEDTAALFLPWADRRWAVFLDSGFPHASKGRYDIIAADPTVTLLTRGSMTEIRCGDDIRLSPEDPFQLVRECLGEVVEPIEGLPFSGGAIGYFAYDLARRLEKLPDSAADAEGLPDMAVGIYDWALVVDHQERKSYLVAQGRSPGLDSRWPHLVEAFSRIPTIGWKQVDFAVHDEARSNLNRKRYGEAFRRIQHYIREGDCYQVNLAQRFMAPCSGNAWWAYQALRVMNPAPFGAYLNYPQAQILSSSPERFLKVRDGYVETRPIKGTRPRYANQEKDAASAHELQSSIKDRAENLMIVDLLRNDIGKTSEPGSVKVPKLFEIESYATVHHLVSTIVSKLEQGCDAVSLLRGCFPGGSITGAPKIRSMEIIEELEPNRRGVYCGSIAYLGFDGGMDSNIAIRTLVRAQNNIRFWAGGGIVADSDPDLEYEECYHKAAAMLNLIEHFKVSATGGHWLGR